MVPERRRPTAPGEYSGATRAELSAMRAHRGTGSSNPFPSSGESTNSRSRCSRTGQIVDCNQAGSVKPYRRRPYTSAAW
jgi:hypothetical protein